MDVITPTQVVAALIALVVLQGWVTIGLVWWLCNSKASLATSGLSAQQSAIANIIESYKTSYAATQEAELSRLQIDAAAKEGQAKLLLALAEQVSRSYAQIGLDYLTAIRVLPAPISVTPTGSSATDELAKALIDEVLPAHSPDIPSHLTPPDYRVSVPATEI